MPKSAGESVADFHACRGNTGGDSFENRGKVCVAAGLGTCGTNEGTENLYGIKQNGQGMLAQLYFAETQIVQKAFQVVGRVRQFLHIRTCRQAP